MHDPLTVRIYSFSYLYSGIPNDETENKGGFVFDCRFLPNPGREPEYVELTGRDSAVIEYLQRFDSVQLFLNHVFGIIDAAVKNYQEREFTNLMVSFGCTGGQHRSVYCAERLKEHLQENNIATKIQHLMIDEK